MQRGTKALDDMRKSIFDQSALAIATNPALISKIFTIKTPREIEMILTHLQIDIDTPSSVAIKRYIEDYGDDYLTSPAPTHTSSMDGLPMTYFSLGLEHWQKDSNKTATNMLHICGNKRTFFIK